MATFNCPGMICSLLFSGLQKKKTSGNIVQITEQTQKKNPHIQHTYFLMSISSLIRSSVEILLLSWRYRGENFPSVSKLPCASLNTCLEQCHVIVKRKQLNFKSFKHKQQEAIKKQVIIYYWEINNSRICGATIHHELITWIIYDTNTEMYRRHVKYIKNTCQKCYH